MKRVKLTTAQIEKFIADKGGKFIEERTVNHRRLVKIECGKCKNIWEAPLNRIIKRGSWCLICHKDDNRINRSKILKLIKDKGYELRTDGELGLKTVFDVYCPIHNFEWKSSYWNFKYSENGGSCRLCSSGAISHQELVDFLASKNGTFIRRVRAIKQDTRKLIVKCNKHNIEFKTNWIMLQSGNWCRLCDDDNRRIKYEQIKQLVEEKNGELLTQNCYSATMLFYVKCKVENCERIWQTSYSRIQSGCWCPRCIGFDRYTVDEIKQIIGNRGILITKEIKNVKQKIDIRCNCGCLFSPYVYGLVRGVWCGACRSGNKSQSELYYIIKSIFTNQEVLYDQYPFDWLKDKQKLEIDIWVPNIKLAIEYDGKQHYFPVKFSNAMTDTQANCALQMTQYHDELKNTLTAQHTDECKYFIRFKYNEPLKKDYVLKKLQSYGVPV